MALIEDPADPPRLSLRAACQALLAHAPADRVRIFGAAGSLGAALAASLTDRSADTLLYVVADDDRVEQVVRDLEFFLPRRDPGDDPMAVDAVQAFPSAETSPYAEVQADRGILQRRMAVLCQLQRGLCHVVVTSAAALGRRVLPPSSFALHCHEINTGSDLGRDALVRALVESGYTRAPVVEDVGTFAVRGAVLDVFPPIYRHPIRIEFIGDDIESLRLYDGATQRTLRPLDRLLIHPVRETVRGPNATPGKRLLEVADAAGFPSSKANWMAQQLDNGEGFFGVESLAPLYHDDMGSLFTYLPASTRVVVEDPGAVAEELRRQLVRLQDSAHRRHGEHLLALEPGRYLMDDVQCAAALAGYGGLDLEPFEGLSGKGIRLEAQTLVGLRAELAATRSDPTGGDDLGHALSKRLRSWMDSGLRVRLVASTRTHAERLAGVLQSLGLGTHEALRLRKGRPTLLSLLDGSDEGSSLAVVLGTLGRGFCAPADGLVLVPEEELFGPRSRRDNTSTARSAVAGSGLGDLTEISENDLIVHDEHGVGRYRGLKKLALRGVEQDFLHLEYDGGTIYLPVYRLGVMRRYIGGEATDARLDKLGGKTWQEKKRKVTGEARKLAEELLQLYAQRKSLPGYAFPPPDAMFAEFEETFPFEETPDQARAIDAVLSDLQADTPMDRLICGDVGYGKTEVALRAAFLAALGGKQVAILAPTTVLVEQHYLTFAERFAGFPVTVARLSRFRGAAEQKRIVADIALGRVDVVVGTHRLLSKDVRWKDLGLVVIDEEQRFGVTHKERLKEIRSQVDVLTLTATPIPRTLQMSMAGMRDISIIATPPEDRLAIRTFVCHFDEELLREALARELGRQGQVFFVHNRIEDLPKLKAKIEALCPGARVAVGHGQMAESELERVMTDFVDGRFDVLISTTIIESGLDIPRANTMIVNHAHRFGLSQLYQMRGRIGRSKERAFCYLVVPTQDALTADAKLRLGVLERFTELGAGFQVASHDLEIRGAGELLGGKQSGMVAALGFDTYARILEEAVAELRGEPIKAEHDPEISVDVPAFLPDDYIPDTGQRLALYRRLAQARHEDDVRDLMIEIADRYGPRPEEADFLGEVMAQKTLVRNLGALGYELGPQRLVISVGTASRLDPGKVLRLVRESAGRWKLTPDMRLSYGFEGRDLTDRLHAARSCLERLGACVLSPS